MSLRTKLLQLLKNGRPEYVSGEQICKQVGVSRTAVWKQVEALRNMGYKIEARSNAGYKLVSIPDRVYPEELKPGLNTSILGVKFKYLPSVVTTNDAAKKWALEGAPDGSILIAEEQTQGKGRLGRGWFSPWGQGLWFSIILRPRVDTVDVPQITLVAAVAVAMAIEKETGFKPGIKWPNDLLAPGGKLCGILTELNADMDRVGYVVLGIGVNVNSGPGDIPGDLQGVASSLAIETGRRVNRVNLLRVILQELDYWYLLWCAEGFKPVLSHWKKWNVTTGHKVHIKTSKETVEGVAIDVDEEGALVVRLNDGGVRSFVAGEVSLRK